MPSSYQLNLSSGASVSDPGSACAIWFNDQFPAPGWRHSGLRWIGFHRYTTQNGGVIDFDGHQTLHVTCTASSEQCWRRNPNGGCEQYELYSTENLRTVAFGQCPVGTMFSDSAQTCVCPMGKDWEPSVNACVPILDENKDQPSKDTCGGNPIYPLTGGKSRSVFLANFSGHEIRLDYSTRKALAASSSYYEPGQIIPPPAGAGPLWSINVQKQFYRNPPNQMVYLGGGKWDMFTGVVDSEGEKSEGLGPDLRLLFKDGFWYVADKLSMVQYKFSSSPSGYSQSVTPLVAFQRVNGARLELEQETPYTNNDWRSVSTLRTITDAFGRQATLEYEVPPAWGTAMPRLKSFTDSNGTINLSYNDKGMLQRVTWPDGSYQEFIYDSGQEDKPWLLTGVRDENGALTASYAYDSAGRAVSTESTAGVNRYAVKQWQQAPVLTVNRLYDAAAGVIRRESTWASPGQVEVETANGGTNTIQTRMVNGMPRITSQTQPAGSGCAASVRQQDYDANGNVAWKEDATNHRICYANDLSRNLQTDRVEGLPSGSDCGSVLANNANLPLGVRKISSAWHPIWRLPTRMSEPRRLTTNVYNGQPDPFNGGSTASCAPSSATLPDGSPMAVLCKQVQQATTDANGSKGLTATVDSAVTARVQQWTYDQYGHLLTYKDPLNNTTTYAYYGDTTSDHTKGDLNTVTNAKQQVTTYTKYNAAGQWLEMKDANDILTTRTFDLRQRLKTVTTANATTTHDYWPTGLLKQLTLPDGGGSLSYGYDDAHRLTSISDKQGNSVTYTLDNNGTRIGENFTDPTGRLARTLARVPDALNRVQQVTGRE